MKELVTDFDVVFRCESPAKLESFLLSYDDSEKSCLYVFDFCSSKEHERNSNRLKNYGFKGSYKHVRSNNRSTGFDFFKTLVEFDRSYEFFNNDYIVFCDGIQLFDDTLQQSADLINTQKCFAVSPVSVDYRGHFKNIQNFNPKCFIIDKAKASKIINNNKVHSYDRFVELAKLDNYSFIVSNAMVFE